MSEWSELAVCLLLLCSSAFNIMEADYGPLDAPGWLQTVNVLFSALYGLELIVRLYAFGFSFFTKAVNVADFAIVVLDLIMLFLDMIDIAAVQSVRVFRGFRTLRLARGMKVIAHYPSFGLMVKGLTNGASSALFGAGLMMTVIAIFSISAVQFINPINERISLTGKYDGCDRCARSFTDVRSSMITFLQQIVMGDDWDAVLIPIMEESPVTTIFFAAVFITLHFMIMNVILAVIVDIALKVSQEDVKDLAHQKENEYLRVSEDLKRLCKTMDSDGSGDLTEDEIMIGFEDHKEFREHLRAMDIKQEDMHVVYSILDADQSGTVNYNEFINELFKMKKHDSHTLLVFIKHYVTEIRRDVQEQVRVLKKDIMSKLADMDNKPGSDMSLFMSQEEKHAEHAIREHEKFKQIDEEFKTLDHNLAKDAFQGSGAFGPADSAEALLPSEGPGRTLPRGRRGNRVSGKQVTPPLEIRSSLGAGDPGKQGQPTSRLPLKPFRTPSQVHLGDGPPSFVATPAKTSPLQSAWAVCCEIPAKPRRPDEASPREGSSHECDGTIKA